MGARWYDPSVGPWTSFDQVVADQFDSRDLNRFSYVRDNPLRYVDPSGHCPVCAVIVLAGIVIGVLSNPTVVNAPAPGDETVPADDDAGLRGGLANAPGTGDVNDAVAGVTGYDVLLGKGLTDEERLLALGAAALPFISAGMVRSASRFAQDGGRIAARLSSTTKDQYRAEARGLFGAVYGRAALTGMDIHHRIPLEWSHLFADLDPNRSGNIVALNVETHKEVGAMWLAFRQTFEQLGRAPTPDEIMHYALLIDNLVKDGYVYL